jgi:hypothetical protein
MEDLESAHGVCESAYERPCDSACTKSAPIASVAAIANKCIFWLESHSANADTLKFDIFFRYDVNIAKKCQPFTFFAWRAVDIMLVKVIM